MASPEQAGSFCRALRFRHRFRMLDSVSSAQQTDREATRNAGRLRFPAGVEDWTPSRPPGTLLPRSLATGDCQAHQKATACHRLLCQGSEKKPNLGSREASGSLKLKRPGRRYHHKLHPLLPSQTRLCPFAFLEATASGSAWGIGPQV